MKQIVLKKLKNETGKDYTVTDSVDYREELTRVMRIRDDGADFEEMGKALQLIAALKAAGEVLILEDAQYDYLRKRLDLVRWRVMDEGVYQFLKDVREAPTYTPPPPPPPSRVMIDAVAATEAVDTALNSINEKTLSM